MVLGTSTGLTYTNNGVTDDGIAIPSYMQYGFNGLGDPRMWKSPKFMDFVFKETTAQDVTVRVTQANHGPQATLGTATFDIGDDATHRAYLRGAARRLALRVEADATKEVELQAAYISYAVQGGR
jgi:hypothetical protein